MALAADTADARGLRLALFTDTFAPQVNGVARTALKPARRISALIAARSGNCSIDPPRYS